MKRLEGRLALDTGAASGIGRVTAVLFAEHGAAVVCLDRSADVEVTAEAIHKARAEPPRSRPTSRIKPRSARRCRPLFASTAVWTSATPALIPQADSVSLSCICRRRSGRFDSIPTAAAALYHPLHEFKADTVRWYLTNSEGVGDISAMLWRCPPVSASPRGPALHVHRRRSLAVRRAERGCEPSGLDDDDLSTGRAVGFARDVTASRALCPDRSPCGDGRLSVPHDLVHAALREREGRHRLSGRGVQCKTALTLARCPHAAACFTRETPRSPAELPKP
jgi:hypothetical protein